MTPTPRSLPRRPGVKTFFTYDTEALPRLRPFMGNAEFSKIYQRGGGEHPSAIELHLGNRYFTVTDEALPNASLDLRHVDASTILRLIQHTGPAFKKAGQNGSTKGKRDIFGRDASRSVRRIQDRHARRAKWRHVQSDVRSASC